MTGYAKVFYVHALLGLSRKKYFTHGKLCKIFRKCRRYQAFPERKIEKYSLMTDDANFFQVQALPSFQNPL